MASNLLPFQWAYQICRCDLFHRFCLVGLGIDSSVIGDRIDLVLLPTNLGDCVGFGFLELGNELVHHIDEDNLGRPISIKPTIVTGASTS